MKKILFITHDTSRTGAPILLLRLMRLLAARGYEVACLIANDNGPLREEFESVAVSDVYYSSLRKNIGSVLRRKIFDATGVGYGNVIGNSDVIINNTITNSFLIKKIRKHYAIPIISYVHELGMTSAYFKDALKNTDAYSDLLLVPSDAVKKFLLSQSIASDKIHRLNYFVPSDDTTKAAHTKTGTEKTFVVGGCGTADWRKGVDLFIQIAIHCLQRYPAHNFKFLWKGVKPGSHQHSMFEYDLLRLGLNERISFEENSNDMNDFYEGIDVFLLTSREDPYPLVVLEAASHRVPTVCFAGGGGAPEFVGADAGTTVGYLSIESASEVLLKYATDASLRNLHGDTALKKLISLHRDENHVMSQWDEFFKKVPVK